MKQTKQLNKAKGFTLIELMVAIAIVAVLSIIGFTLFQGAQANARDTKRRQDVDAIATSLENTFDANSGTYAQLSSQAFTNSAIPTDPLGTAPYTYSFNGIDTAASSSYTVCADLEKKGSGNYDSSAGTSTTGSLDFYCRKSQQK